MLQIFVIEIWIMFACIVAVLEAMIFHWKVKAGYIETDYEEHTWFTLIRSCLGIGLLIMLYFNVEISILRLCFFGVGLVCMFPFFHDGIYYMVRNSCLKKYHNKPPLYPAGFFSQSKTSDAKTELTFEQRLLTLLVSTIILIIVNLPFNGS